MHDASSGRDVCNRNCIAMTVLCENLLIAASFPLYRRNDNSIINNDDTFVKLKDRKRSLSGKTTTTRCGIRETATTRNVALEKQPQREILRCGSCSEDRVSD